jgi:hypothetical protein
MSLARPLWEEEALCLTSREGSVYRYVYIHIYTYLEICHIASSMTVKAVVVRGEDRPCPGGPGGNLYIPRVVEGYASPRGVAEVSLETGVRQGDIIVNLEGCLIHDMHYSVQGLPIEKEDWARRAEV